MVILYMEECVTNLVNFMLSVHQNFKSRARDYFASITIVVVNAKNKE